MDFMHLMERMSEPLGYGVKGSGKNMVYYEVPEMEASVKATINATMMGQARKIPYRKPSNMPENQLKEIGQLCPKTGLFGYFIPAHRKASINLRRIFLAQPNVPDLFNMACACRDNSMVHPHLFVHALSSCLATRKDTKDFDMPAFYEVMPELFFTDHVMKQAEKMARMPDKCKSLISVDENTTGHQTDPESRLSYFREDLGVNSHHFHWHVVYPGDYEARMESKRDRRGELFYYMHHSMIARYDAERLCNGLSRTKLFDFDNLVIEEGYFGKLYSTNAGRHWGTRQANTKLVNIVGKTDGGPSADATVFDLKIEDLKRWRDRILEAVDTGVVIQKRGNENSKILLDEDKGIDILGDILENSQDTPHAQFYGVDGFHNMGHLLIACSHDPHGSYREFFGPMGDTSTAMRDPAFYRWHKYIDDMFDVYKRTLGPYQLDQGKWPLKWNGIEVMAIEVKNSNPKFQAVKNVLSTYWMRRDVEISRGLDFYRTEMANGGGVRARVTHLNYDLFTYVIRVNNTSGRNMPATVRIFMAPRFNEHGERFTMAVQRLMFFEVDKFSHQLTPGTNVIQRQSVDSSVTVKLENTFRQLEELNNTVIRDDIREEKDKGRCGCGWPQHLLLPRGKPAGMKFDLFVMLTDGQKDQILRNGLPPKSQCRDALSFCGIIDEKYPDPRPMGYPFDRVPYDTPGMMGNTPVPNLDEYVKHIKNSGVTEVTIVHEPDRKVIRESDANETNGVETMNENDEAKAHCGNGGDRGGTQMPMPMPPNRGPPIEWSNPAPGINRPYGRRPGGRYGREGGDDYDHEDWDYLDN